MIIRIIIRKNNTYLRVLTIIKNIQYTKNKTIIYIAFINIVLVFVLVFYIFNFHLIKCLIVLLLNCQISFYNFLLSCNKTLTL